MTDRVRPTAAPSRHDLGDLLRLSGFVRLLAVRWPSQAGDGLFQLGAASLLLFTLDPTKATSAAEVAEIMAVTTLPFTLAGPFAGVVIDRWRRQRILVWTNVVRIAVGAGGLAVAGLRPWGQPVFLAAVVVVLSVNRFFLATLGAVLPRVVPGEALVPANGVATVGGAVVSLGGAAGGGLIAGLIGEDAGGPEVVVGLAAGAFLASVIVAGRLPVKLLGPDHDTQRPPLRRELRRAAGELADGARRIAAARRAWAPIAVLAALRFVTAIAAIAALLVFRNVYGAGPAQIGLVLSLFGVGAGVGAVGVTVAERRFGLPPERGLTAALVLGGLAVVVLTPGLRRWALYAINVLLGVAFAAAKIPGDALVQSALPDRYRGRVFAAYDVLYNLGWLLGGVATAVAVPRTSAAEPALIGCGLATLAFYPLARRWLTDLPPPVDVIPWDAARRALD